MKKGLTLIEVLISAALIGTIIAYEVSFFGRFIIVSRKSAKEQEIERYIQEAFDFIRDKVENCVYLRTEENCIIVAMPGDETEDRIELESNDSLVIKSGKSTEKYPPVIADYIRDFNVFIHGKVMYVSITDTYGKKYEKCYRIGKLK